MTFIESERRPIVACAVITVFLSLAWVWPNLLHPRKVPDRGDPVFSAWRLARFAHQLRNDPRRLFDGNIFYPRPWTLAYSDATLLEGVAAAPFIWAGADPLIVGNALLLMAFPLCGLAFFYAGYRITGNPLAGLVTGVMGAWHPFHAEHYSHLELQSFMFVPLAFVAVFDAVADPTWRRGLWVGTVVGLQCLASMYLGLMLGTVLVVLGGVTLWQYRTRSLKRLLSAACGAGLVLIPVAAIFLVPYREASRAHGERSAEEVTIGSATPGDYLKTTRRLTSYSWHSRQFNHAERELYPGASPISLAAIGSAGLPAATVLPLLAAGAAAFDWSLGSNGLTYRYLRALSPYKNVRVPARFAILLGSALILLAGHGAHRIVNRGSRRRQILATACIVALVAVDLRTKIELIDYYPQIPSFYDRVPSTAVLAELPAGRDFDYMYFSTKHWASLLTGYSGFIAVDDSLAAALSSFPSVESIDRLRARGATHLTYNCAFERSPERCRHNLAELAANPTLEIVATEMWQSASAQLYRIR